MKTLKEPTFFLKYRLFILSHLSLLILLILWFSPFSRSFFQKLDHNTFFLLNGSLTYSSLWQEFWGLLNHRRETLLNLIFAALFNIWAILSTKEKCLRRVRLKQTLYFWLFFQIGVMLQNAIFHNLMHIVRFSPSLVLKPFIKLSLILNNPDIKDFSEHSFPGGHAFAMIYWASFTQLCAPKFIARLGLFFAILLCIPRLFSGAHWLSDIIFSGLLGLIWLSWITLLPIYAMLTKKT